MDSWVSELAFECWGSVDMKLLVMLCHPLSPTGKRGMCGIRRV